MAARTPRSRASAPRASAKSRRPSTAEVEVVEEAPGMGLDAGIGIVTSIVLVVAIVMVDKLMSQFGKGFFF
jgi:hypothetical protein